MTYIRATDLNGISWGTPVIVDNEYNSGYDSVLKVIDGKPAISYRDGGNKILYYVQANDINGNTWSTPEIVDSRGDYTSLALIGNSPAISYRGSLKYARKLGKPVAYDFEGNYQSDLLWRNGTTGSNVIWLMNNATMKSGEITNVSFAESDTVWDGKFDGDNKSDLLVYNTASGVATMNIMNGTQAAEIEDIATGINPNQQIAGIGNFNSTTDFVSDIAWRNTTTGANEIWLMDKFTILSQVPLPTVDINWNLIGVGDFNGDGHSDLFWRKNTGHNVIWFMNGTTVLPSSGNVYTVTDFNWKIIAIYDFDGDRKSDLFWRNEVTGFNVIWLMDGLTIKSSGNTSWVDLNWKVVALGSYGTAGNMLWRKQVDNSAFSIIWKQISEGKPASSASTSPQELRLEWKIIENTPQPARDIRVNNIEIKPGTMVIKNPPLEDLMPKQKPTEKNTMKKLPPLPVMQIVIPGLQNKRKFRKQ